MEPAVPPPLRLLLVDPDPPTLELLQPLFQEEGYHVTLADTLDKAQEHLAGQTFHLVITELFFRRAQDPFQAVGRLACSSP